MEVNKKENIRPHVVFKSNMMIKTLEEKNKEPLCLNEWREVSLTVMPSKLDFHVGDTETNPHSDKESPTMCMSDGITFPWCSKS